MPLPRDSVHTKWGHRKYAFLFRVPHAHIVPSEIGTANVALSARQYIYTCPYVLMADANAP